MMLLHEFPPFDSNEIVYLEVFQWEYNAWAEEVDSISSHQWGCVPPNELEAILYWFWEFSVCILYNNTLLWGCGASSFTRVECHSNYWAVKRVECCIHRDWSWVIGRSAKGVAVPPIEHELPRKTWADESLGRNRETVDVVHNELHRCTVRIRDPRLPAVARCLSFNLFKAVFSAVEEVGVLISVFG